MKEKKQNPEKITDEYVRRLEDQLHDIEVQEIRFPLPKQGEPERGTESFGSHAQSLPSRDQGRNENLAFAPGIEYRRLADSISLESLLFPTIADLADVETGTLIASRKIPKAAVITAGLNVRTETEGGQEHFRAMVKGKVVILQNTLTVVPSDIDCKVSIHIAKDEMAALLDCEPGFGAGKVLTEEVILSMLREHGVVHGIQHETIRITIDSCNDTRMAQKGIIAARGTPSTSGKNGSLQFASGGDSHGSGFRLLPDGRVDYKRTSVIQTVQKGQLLAYLVAPENGVPGLNVLCQSLPAQNGAPARILPGQGVMSPDGVSFIADAAGCVLWRDPTLQILDIYVVNGDVDFSSGSIDFNGSVIVKGGVCEGFEVIAEGDIIVWQTAEACVLKAGRDIHVFGGIQGQGRGLLVAGRDITAEYVQNATLEAQGEIVIRDFAVNSRIFTSRSLRAQEKHGSIVGGESYARSGMDVRGLGSAGGTKTYLCAGFDFVVSRRINEIDGRVRACEESIRKIDLALKPISELLQKNPSKLASRREIIERAVLRRKELQEQHEALLVERTRLQQQLSLADEPSFIKVSQICYPDVTIQIRNSKLHVSRQLENIRFHENTKDRTIEAGAY